MKNLNQVSPTNYRVFCWIAVFGIFAAASDADWLVTRAGERIETQGGWQVKGRLVIFTQPGGMLSSLRLSEVDLDASREATNAAAEAAARPAAQPPPPPRRPARVITTDDIGTGVPGAENTDLLIERLRQAHRLKDVGLAMGLVNWQDVPTGVREYIRNQFEWLMDRRIQGMRFIEADPEASEEDLQKLQDSVVYQPDVEVAGEIEVDLFPDPNQSERSLTFQVGTHLDSFFIAAPREVGE